MNDFLTYRLDRQPEGKALWIHAGFRPSQLFALQVLALQENFELIGLSDQSASFSDETKNRLEGWGLIVPVASRSPFWESLDEDFPENILRTAIEDAGVCDLLFWENPSILREALALSQKIQRTDDGDLRENLDLIVFSLGQAMEYGEDGVLTTLTRENPFIWNEIFSLGRQRFVLDPRLSKRLSIPGWLQVLWQTFLEEIGEKDQPMNLDPLLSLYVYSNPGIFLFEEKSAHCHSQNKEAGWLHFSEGSDFYLATDLQQEAFFEDLQKLLKIFPAG